MIKSQSNVNMRKTCNFYCVVFVILFLEWILGIKNLLNLSGNDYIKEKRFATFKFKYVSQGFHQVWYQGGVKATVYGVVEDLKFKISEGSDQNWCFPDCAQLAVSAKLRQPTGQTQDNFNFGPSLLKFLT